MILERILAFLDAHKAASLNEIAGAVESSPDAVRSMMQTLQRKGLVYRFRPQSGCGTSCRQCAEGMLEVYGHGAGSVPPQQAVRCEGLTTQS